MRRFLTCLLVVACGCGNANADGAPDGQAGRTASGGAGGKLGSAANGGSQAAGVGGASGTGGGGAFGGQGGSGAHAGAGGSALGMIELVPNVIAGKQTGAVSAGGAGGTGGVGAQKSALRVGSPSSTSLLSLKYYITNIQLCEDAELMGSGFKSTSGCISLYQNMQASSPDYNTYTVEEAQADETPGRYVDLMSADGQAALRKPVTLQVPVAATAPSDAQDVEDADGGVPEAPQRQPGVYRYGFINFYRPIKVKAEFPIIGEAAGNYFRTKAVTKIDETMPANGLNMDRVEIGNTLDGATEETTYMLNSGGALFVFQKPFVITQADVDAKAQIFIDLVFNPESFGQAYASDCDNDVRVVVCDPTNNVAIDMPYVHMSPVPRKQGQRTRKETYLVDYDDNAKLRIELYYNDADSEASIQGVDTAIVYNSGAAPSLTSFNTVASNFVTQRGSVSTSDASVSLLDYERSVNLEDLVRRHDGTVKIHCLFPGAICSTQRETVSRAYTYVDDRVVSGE